MSEMPGAVYATADNARRLRLDGDWRVGGPAAPEFKFEVFKAS